VLHVTSLDVDAINRAVNPRFLKRNWFYLPRFLTGNEAQASPISALLLFEGSGELRIDQLMLRKLPVRDLTAKATWAERHLKLSNASAKALGGKLSGEMDFDFTRGMDATARIALADADLSATSGLLGVPWAHGRFSVNGNLAFSGPDAKQLADSLTADLHFTAANGSLRRWSPVGDLRFQHWTGDATVEKRSFTITRSLLTNAQREMAITGVIGPDLALDMTERMADTTVKLGGTLLAPEAAATPDEAASNAAHAPEVPHR
jgi:hypothetical protein